MEVPELVIDKVPASIYILALPVKFNLPLKLLLPEIFLKAPSLFIPVPVILIFASATVIPPCICKAALSNTVVAIAVFPSALLFWIFNTPL